MKTYHLAKSYQFLLATLLFALASVPDVRAQQKAVPAPAVTPAAAPAVAAKPAMEEESTVQNKPAAQGIKIHGHWVIQVKNADGTLGERREFDNSLTTVGGSEISGDQVLGMLLSGNAVTGDPAVAFSNNTAAVSDPGPICLNTDGKIAAGGPGCGLLTTTESLLYSNSGNTLSASGSVAQTGLSMLASVSPAVTWVLSGTYTVVANQTTIGTVQTLISVCSQTLGTAPIRTTSNNYYTGISSFRSAPSSPSTCDLADWAANTTPFSPRIGTLTSTIVTPALTVTPGQLVQVTVTISFS
jgi:hypothetical protein